MKMENCQMTADMFTDDKSENLDTWYSLIIWIPWNYEHVKKFDYSVIKIW